MNKEEFIETYINNKAVKDTMRKQAMEYLEVKALAYAFKAKIEKELKEKIIKAKRTYPHGKSNEIKLVLGYNLFNLLVVYCESKYSRLSRDIPDYSNMSLGGMPILVSCNKDVIDIVCTGDDLEWGFNPTSKHIELVDMEQLIEELPEDGKFKEET